MSPFATLLNWLAPLLHPLGDFRNQVSKLTTIHQESVQTFGALAGALVGDQTGPEAFTGELESSFWESVQTYLNAENAFIGAGVNVASMDGIVEEASTTCETCATEITGAAEVAATEVAGDVVLDEVTGVVDVAAVAEGGANPIADVAALILTLVAGAALLITLTKLAWDIYSAIQQWQRSMYKIADTPLHNLPPNPTPIPAPTPTPNVSPARTKLSPQQQQEVNDILTQLSKEGVNGVSEFDVENLVRQGYDRKSILDILLAGISATLSKVQINAQLAGLNSHIDESQQIFSLREKRVAYLLSSEGKSVVALPQQGSSGRRGDALVDGVITEFKTLDPGADSDTIRNTLQRSIKRGGQARNIIIDARGSGLTDADASRGMARMKNLSRGKIDSVRIIGTSFDITSTDFN